MNELDYDLFKNSLYDLDTDDTISSAHGILCGFACVNVELNLEEWLGELLLGADFDLQMIKTKEELAFIFNKTLEQLNSETLNFQLLIANDEHSLSMQITTLVEWCQGFLMGLGLKKIAAHDESVLEMIKDFSEISKLEEQILEDEQNSQDLNEIVEFVRMGVLFIQESLQPSKQDFVNPEYLH
jgi:uncharacterized protein YgfB (UPF0149 family)